MNATKRVPAIEPPAPVVVRKPREERKTVEIDARLLEMLRARCAKETP